MSALKDQATPIIRTAVPENKRQYFLPPAVGAKYMLAFEFYVYELAAQQIKDYTSGLLEFYNLSNGGWYMAPEIEGPVQMDCPNLFSGTLSADAAGIALTIIAINHLMWSVHETDPERGKKLHDAWSALREYAWTHEEAAEIYGVID